MEHLFAYMGAGGAAGNGRGGQARGSTNGAAPAGPSTASLRLHHRPSPSGQQLNLGQALAIMESLRHHPGGHLGSWAGGGDTVLHQQQGAHHHLPGTQRQDSLALQLAATTAHDYSMAPLSHAASIDNHVTGAGLSPHDRAELIREIMHSSRLHNPVAEQQTALPSHTHTAMGASATSSIDGAALARMLLEHEAAATRNEGAQAAAAAAGTAPAPAPRIDAANSTDTAAAKSIDKMDLLATVAAASHILDGGGESAVSPALSGGVDNSGMGDGMDDSESPHAVSMFPVPGGELQKGPPLGSKQSAPRSERASGGRKIGRMRRYSEQNGAYGIWEDVYAESSGTCKGFVQINLNRGGKIGVCTKLLSENKQRSLSTAMHQCKMYRQYTRSQVFHEPRFHVLLSSKAQADAGYMYHGIHMKAHPIDLVPEVASYAKVLAKAYGLPQEQWNIGVDLIVYRDGEDSIGWHADNTQGESTVLCVVVDAPGEPRPVYIRPNKRAKKLAEGDEEIQLYIGECDAYDMDGLMQAGYEHSLPKRRESKSPRFVLIFRHGYEASVPHDSGTAITEMAAAANGAEEEGLLSLLSRLRVKPPPVVFGHAGVQEGSCYSRRFLYATGAHRADQRGINGSAERGSDSIVVSRQNPDCREEDGLQWLRYTSSRRQGAGALCLSHNRKLPVRVFRSSNLKSTYAPPDLETGQTSYRYDGIYLVTKVWDENGDLLGDSVGMPSGRTQYTFHLERLPKSPSDGASASIQNSLSVDEIWQRIQLSQRRQLTVEFVPPCPKHDDKLPGLPDDDSDSCGSRSNSDSPSWDHNFPYLMPHGANVALPPPRATPCLLPKTSRDALQNASPASQSAKRYQQRYCDFTNQKSIFTRFGFKKGKGKLTPLLSDIAECKTREEKAKYVRIWRTLTKEQQEQYKKDKAEKEEARDRKIFGLLSALTNPSDQPDSQTPGALLDADLQQQTNCDFTNPKSIKASFGFERGKGKLAPLLSDIAKCKTDVDKTQFVRVWRAMTKERQKKWKESRKEAKTIQVTGEAAQEMEIFACSVILAQYWNDAKVLVSDSALDELEAFVSDSAKVILEEAASGAKRKESQKKRAKVNAAAKADSRNKKMAARTEKKAKVMPAGRTKRGEAQPDGAKFIPQHRLISPRFITIDGGRRQSLSYPCEASCKVGRRTAKSVKVSVKWSNCSPPKQGLRVADSAVSDRKRKEPEVEPALNEPGELTPRRKSARQSKGLEAAEELGATSQDIDQRQSSTYSRNEGIFAWDKGHLYEAKVLKTKETKGGVKHLVHYLGYKKSHDRWLTTQSMMKDTPSNREYFEARLRDDPTVQSQHATNQSSQAVRQTAGRQTAGRQTAKPTAVPANTARERPSRAPRRIAVGKQPRVGTKVDSYEDAAINTKTNGRKRKNLEKKADETIVTQVPRRKSSRLVAPKDPPESKEETKDKDERAAADDEMATKEPTAKSSKAVDNHSTDVPEVGRRVNVKFDDGKLYSGEIKRVTVKQRKTRAASVSSDDQPAYGIRIRYDDGDVATETYPGADIQLEPVISVAGNEESNKETATAPATATKSKRALKRGDVLARARNDDTTATQADTKGAKAPRRTSSRLAPNSLLVPQTAYAVNAPSVGTRVKVKFDDGKFYRGTIARVKAKRKAEASDLPAYSIRIQYDDGDVATETFPDAAIQLERGTGLAGKEESSDVAIPAPPRSRKRALKLGKASVRKGADGKSTFQEELNDAEANDGRKLKRGRPKSSAKSLGPVSDVEVDSTHHPMPRKRRRNDAIRVPEVGMRVKVKWDDGKFYRGTIARVKAKRKAEVSDLPAYSIQIRYDDGDVATETFPDAAIQLERGAGLARKEESNKGTDVSPSRATKPRGKAVVRKANDGKKALEKDLHDTKPTAGGKRNAGRPKSSAKSGRTSDAKVQRSKQPMPRARRRKSANSVPEVGMNVSVTFKNGRRYSGLISQVRAKREKTASGQDTFSIRIHYNDGDVETTTYPDPDIVLGGHLN